MDVFSLFKLFICICLSEVSYGKKNTENKADGFKECRRCKTLTDSFQFWIEKTSRGKYEGGDTAWEEANLKSYSRSEVRLIEVQEGLCSEVKREKDKDHCYSLAEEAEQVLEKWWFQENRDATDLFSWVCIENLKYCCPKNHFGDSCKPCARDINNEICGNHGTCDGQGTRTGNGTCICKRGYSGKHCEDCDENFYRTNKNLCDQCHRACNGCSAEGAGACANCKSGWQSDSGVCIDVNECVDISVCKLGQFCENLEGSYICKTCDKSCKTCLGPSAINCTSCESKNILWLGTCIDNDIRNVIFMSALKRILLYIVFLVLFFILCRSKSLDSYIVIFFAICVYFFEYQSRYNVLDSVVIYFKIL